MKYKLIFGLVLFVSIISCAGTVQKELDDEVEEVKCEKSSVNDFDEFLNIPYGISELYIDTILGKSTGGSYSEDSTAFLYEFKNIDTAPITVWSNGKTGKVETVFVEILSLEDGFKSDVRALAETYNMKSCEALFLGMMAEEIIEKLGKPDKDVRNEEKGFRSIFYDSKDLRIALNFKCYDSQEKMCSSISVNWFY